MKVSQTRNGETTYLQRAQAAQPPIKPTEHPYRPARRKRRRGMLNVECLNNKKSAKTPKVEMAYQERASAAQPHREASNRVHGINGPSRQRGRIKFEPINVNLAQNSKTAYLQHADIARPPDILSKRRNRVIGPIQHAEHPYGDVGRI